MTVRAIQLQCIQISWGCHECIAHLMSQAIKDPWEDVVNYDSLEYSRGYKDGQGDGKQSGFYDDGIKCGFLKGFAIGAELAFYSEVCEKIQNKNLEEKTHDLMKAKLIENFSISNNNLPSHDYDELVIESRHSYKLLQSHQSLPSFSAKSEVKDKSLSW